MKSRSIAVMVAMMLAVAATLAIFLYVQGVRRTHTKATQNQVVVIVSKKQIAAGTRLDGLISSGDFITMNVPAGALVDGAVTDLSQLKGQTTRYPILEGEQIPVGRLQGSTQLKGGALGIPEGHVAVTLPLDLPQAVGGNVAVGDHVSIYASFDDITLLTGDLKKIIAGQAETKKVELGDYTVTIVPDVQILKVDNPTSTGGIGNSSQGMRITFALEPVDAQNVVQANAKGSVWLALLPPNEQGQLVPPSSITRLLLDAAQTRQVAA
jgi:pilus assembly protein CpaB